MPGPALGRRDPRGLRPADAGAALAAGARRPRPPGRHRLRLDPARGPGHRALGGRVVRQEPALLRPREHREARDGGRLQRGRLDPRRAGRRRAPVRAPDPVPAQVQPQRVPDLPEQVRPDLLRPDQAGAGHGRGRGGRHDLLRLRPSRRARSSRSRRPSRPRTRWGWRRCCGATCATPPSRQGEGLPRLGRPHRPGQPPRGHDRGRHHQAEAAGEQRRLQRDQHARRTRTARSTSGSTPS